MMKWLSRLFTAVLVPSMNLMLHWLLHPMRSLSVSMFVRTIRRRLLQNRKKVDLCLYRVIYNAIEDIEAAMKGMLEPTFEEKIIGHAEVRQTYKVSGVGTIIGGYVQDGKIVRNCKVRLLRDNVVIHEGELASLKRFKDDVKEVNSGYECGMSFEKYNDIKEGDQIEAFVMEEVPR